MKTLLAPIGAFFYVLTVCGLMLVVLTMLGAFLLADGVTFVCRKVRGTDV